MERVNKRTGGNRTLIIDQLPDLMGLKATKVKEAKGKMCHTNSPRITLMRTSLQANFSELTNFTLHRHKPRCTNQIEIIIIDIIKKCKSFANCSHTSGT